MLSPSGRVASDSEPREDRPLPSKAEALSTFPEGEGKRTMSLPLGGKVPSESEANEGRD